MVRKLSRREFLKGAAVTGVGLYGAAVLPLEVSAATGKSRIVFVNSPKVLVNAGTAATPSKLGMASVGEVDATIDQAVLNTMLSQGMQAFTGTKSDVAAWRKLFKASDVVGIKVNCLFAKDVSTHPEVIASIIAGLKLAGVKEDNIIVWDRNDREMIRSGYRINRDAGVKCYGTEGEYDAEPTKQGSFNGRMSKIVTEKITALINVPILKDHGIAGITCAMKNHYGTHINPGDHHGNNCDPFLAELNSVPAIKDKTRLIICDALRPLANGGPGLKTEFLWEHKTLMISADPVAMDHQGWQIIEARRAEIGLKPLAEIGRPTKFITTAASMGLGTNDPAKMEIIRITV